MAHLRRSGIGGTLRPPVPADEAPSSIGAQLSVALSQTGVSQRELARRLALIDQDGATWESKRRWLAKLISDEVERPQPESLREISEALGLSADYFQTAPPAEPASIRHRLEALADSVDQVLAHQREMLERLDELVAQTGTGQSAKPTVPRRPTGA